MNAACRWTDNLTTLAPSGDPARRAHLLEDARISKELAIRYADKVAGRLNTPTWHSAETRCIEQSLTEIAQRHHVSRAEITAVASARELWIDLLAVFLPVAVLFAAASYRIAARVVAGYDREDHGLAAAMLIVLAPIAAGVALGVAQIWGVSVEQLRVRDEHISYRAFELPASRHGWLLWVVAIAVFVTVSAVPFFGKETDHQTGPVSARKKPYNERHRKGCT